MTSPPPSIPSSGSPLPTYDEMCPIDDGKHDGLKQLLEAKAFDASTNWKNWIPLIGPAIQASTGDWGTVTRGTSLPDIDAAIGLAKAELNGDGTKTRPGLVAQWRDCINHLDGEFATDLNDLFTNLSDDISTLVEAKVYGIQEWIIVLGINLFFLGVIIFCVVFYYR